MSGGPEQSINFLHLKRYTLTTVKWLWWLLWTGCMFNNEVFTCDACDPETMKNSHPPEMCVRALNTHTMHTHPIYWRCTYTKSLSHKSTSFSAINQIQSIAHWNLPGPASLCVWVNKTQSQHLDNVTISFRMLNKPTSTRTPGTK